jgi:hypothetical protein
MHFPCPFSRLTPFLLAALACVQFVSAVPIIEKAAQGAYKPGTREKDLQKIVTVGNVYVDKAYETIHGAVKKDPKHVADLTEFVHGHQNFAQLNLPEMAWMMDQLKTRIVQFKNYDDPADKKADSVSKRYLAVTHLTFPSYVDLHHLFWTLEEWEQAVTVIHEATHFLAHTWDYWALVSGKFTYVGELKDGAVDGAWHSSFDEVINKAPHLCHMNADFIPILGYWLAHGKKYPPKNTAQKGDHVVGTHMTLSQMGFTAVEGAHGGKAGSQSPVASSHGSGSVNSQMAQAQFLPPLHVDTNVAHSNAGSSPVHLSAGSKKSTGSWEHVQRR